LILGLTGLGIGSALMYWFDPASGKRRRSHARYQARRVKRRAEKVIDTTSHTLEKVGRMGFTGVGKALIPVTAKLLWR
jgi:hypothetical protein